MRCVCGRVERGLIAAIGVAALLFVAFLPPQEVVGSEDAMKTLPAFERFRCALCHTVPTPTDEQPDLNAFGKDFLNNNSIWDHTLASMNSDGDRCSNGAELGDRDGDGEFDESSHRPRENSNPGNPADCTAPIDPATWGIIKQIFSKEFEEYVFEDTGWEYLALYFDA
jgi:hypothetical protein